MCRLCRVELRTDDELGKPSPPSGLANPVIIGDNNIRGVRTFWSRHDVELHAISLVPTENVIRCECL